MKNGNQIKGIVVEEYVDRIKFSTVDGEIDIKKARIKDILYDLPVQNLIKLGDFHKQKGNFTRAYLYYQKAHQADPDFEAAKARYLYMQSQLLIQPHEQMEKQIQKKKALLQPSVVKTAVSTEDKLKEQIGIELVSKGERFYINKVYPKTPAHESGITASDYIAAIWNRLTDYMEFEDACDMILDTKTGEVRLTIERTVKLNAQEGAGFRFDITENGLSVTDVTDNSILKNKKLLTGDVIYKIADKPTRYMPIKEANALMKSFGKELQITIRRDIILWQKRG